MCVRIGLVVALIGLSFWLGRTDCQKTTAFKQIREIKYVAFQKAEISARPHAAKSELLELMRRGKL